jgi:SSS family solute:Na+ symporter
MKSMPAAVQYIALSPAAKPMAENMFRALWSGLICATVTVVVSLMTKPKPDAELVNLVYGCTVIPSEGHLPLWQRPIFWAGVVSGAFVAIQIIFW